jgi:hypothetical protein
MLEVRRDVDFREESFRAQHPAESRPQHLQRHTTPVLQSSSSYTVAMPPAPISLPMR